MLHLDSSLQIQSDIFDHLIAVIPEFGLKVFNFIDSQQKSIMFGYRLMTDSALEIGVESGFFVNVHMGHFKRTQSKETKILPMNDE